MMVDESTEVAESTETEEKAPAPKKKAKKAVKKANISSHKQWMYNGGVETGILLEEGEEIPKGYKRGYTK